MTTPRIPAPKRGEAMTGMSYPTLCAFIGPAQRQAVYHGLRGEEKQYFANTLRRISGIIEGMPKTYESESVADPKVWLHYFTGTADWYVTEKDLDTDGADYGYMVHWCRTAGPGAPPKFYPVSNGVTADEAIDRAVERYNRKHGLGA